MKKRDTLTSFLIIMISCLVLGGCAVIQKDKAHDTENKLSASGFKMYLADTPEKMAHLQSQPQLKMVAHRKDGKLVYTYADAQYAMALYVGDSQAYQQYQKLLFEKNITKSQEETAEDMDDMNAWYMWGQAF